MSPIRAPGPGDGPLLSLEACAMTDRITFPCAAQRETPNWTSRWILNVLIMHVLLRDLTGPTAWPPLSQYRVWKKGTMAIFRLTFSTWDRFGLLRRSPKITFKDSEGRESLYPIVLNFQVRCKVSRFPPNAIPPKFDPGRGEGVFQLKLPSRGHRGIQERKDQANFHRWQQDQTELQPKVKTKSILIPKTCILKLRWLNLKNISAGTFVVISWNRISLMKRDFFVEIVFFLCFGSSRLIWEQVTWQGRTSEGRREAPKRRHVGGGDKHNSGGNFQVEM